MTRIIYQVFTDVWRLARKYEFRRLTDSEWAAFCGQGEELLEKYREYGPEVETLYRDLFRAVQALYQRGGCGGKER